ncbi:DUF6985 domain-containing protein [Planctomycetes bacterium Poly30]|uniref:DUF6985 domain-containing protein n=1 Tax=Saltatorellus ferox TaxID=2528018 RepID=UPI00119DF6F5
MDIQRIETGLYSIDVPTLFEKRLIHGQLLRLERMDRAAGEASFAEVNFFVGFTAEERIDDPRGDDAETVREALLDEVWQRYESGEAAIAPLRVESESRSAGARRALVRLEPTSWRPESGQFVYIFIPPSSGQHVFSRLVLEFDWSLRELYESIGEGLVESLTWKRGAIADEDVRRQAEKAWSAFDEMDPKKIESITYRYREILSQNLPEPVEPMEPAVLDLTPIELDSLTLEQLDEALGQSTDGSRSMVLKTAFLPDEIKVTLETEFDDSYAFGPGTLSLVRALGALSSKDHPRAGELLWEHCKMCFEVTDYGAGSQSNEDYFGIRNPEDALRAAGKGRIYLGEVLNGGSHDLFQIDFYPPWEEEHGCSLVVRNGELVATSDPGGWLGEFEVAEGEGRK